MRLWSLHPSYLDARGLVALWREALLARQVLSGRTTGYHRHPQLDRFRAAPRPRAAIDRYLREIYSEGNRRGYRFDEKKLQPATRVSKIAVGRGQLLFELNHLRSKLKKRDPAAFARLTPVVVPLTHPLFKVTAGGVAPWEKAAAASARPALS